MIPHGLQVKLFWLFFIADLTVLSLVERMSSKKKQRNAFFFYMLDMQEELRRQGRNVAMAQMSAIAGPKWSVSMIIIYIYQLGINLLCNSNNIVWVGVIIVI